MNIKWGVCLFLLLALLTCGAWAQDLPDEAGAFDAAEAMLPAAQSLLDRLHAVASDEAYLSSLTVNDETLVRILQMNAQTQGEPQRMLMAFADADAIDLALALTVLPGSSALTLETMRMRLGGTVSSFFNGMQGSSVIAAAAVSTVSDVFLFEGASAGVSFVLIDYGEEAPTVCASFSIKEGGLASGSASFVVIGEEDKARLFNSELPALLTGVGEALNVDMDKLLYLRVLERPQ